MLKRPAWSIILTFIIGLLFVTASVSEAQPPTVPILIVSNQSGDGVFGQYIGEILKAEGLNAFDTIDIGAMNAGLLAEYEVVILGRSPLNAGQIADLTSYVNAGGRLIAMRPDAQLKTLAGLGASAGLQTDGYLKIINAAVLNGQTPGSGLTAETLQLHGAADRYASQGGTVMLAELYSDSATATGYPAVIGNPSGSGWMVTFTYDLPLNVIYTRQGNPALAGIDVDGDTAVRTTDLFQSQPVSAPTWIDRNKIPIPQADEQQRFLGRLVRQMVKMPLPQLWYFPGMTKTMLLMTSDAHANPTSYYDTIIASLNAHNADATFYLSQGNDQTPESIAAWRAHGHEFGIHPYDVKESPPIESLSQGYTLFYDWFTTNYGMTVSPTVRHHRVAWPGPDWMSTVDLEASYGIRMDTNFYHWGPWFKKSDDTWPHGYLTGSGLPMKFVKLDGTILPVYQQATQLVDEQLIAGIYNQLGDPVLENLNGDQAFLVSKELIDASQAGYYSALMTQFHVDYYAYGDVTTWAESTMDYANSLGIPMWSADEWLNFTELRDASDFTNLVWDPNQGVLTFDLNASSVPGSNLSILVPANHSGDALVQVKVDGSPAIFQLKAVNGVSMAFISVPAGPHTFRARYHPEADLSISKLDNADPVIAGQALTYTMHVTNAGPDEVSSATVTDILPLAFHLVSAIPTQGSCSGTTTVSCALNTIPSSGSVTITIFGTVDPAQRLSLSNTASVSSPAMDPDLANNSATATTTVTASADISLVMSDVPDPVTAGTELVYTLTVSNAGPSTATGVSMTQTLPAGSSYVSGTGSNWTCNPASGSVTCNLSSAINVGGSASVQVKVAVNPARAADLSSTATASASESDPNEADNSDSETTVVERRADISLVLSDAPDPVIAGNDLTYTLAVNNAGPSTASAVSMTQTLPAGVTYVDGTGAGWTCSQVSGTVTCDLANLGAGAASSVVVKVTVDPARHDPLDTSATVSATESDPQPANNDSSASTGVERQADLVVSVLAAPDPVIAGHNLTYTITVQNNGPSTAESTSVVSVLPPAVTYVSAAGDGWACMEASGTVTCGPRLLEPGFSGTIEIVVTAPGGLGTILNQVSVDSITADADSSNNSASVSTSVTASADLSLALSISEDPARAAHPVEYTLSVSNLGVSTADSLSATFNLPVNSVFMSAAGTGWTCSEAAGVVTCTLPQLAVGTAAPVKIQVFVLSTGTNLTAEAAVTSATGDPSMGNNSQVLTTELTYLNYLPVVSFVQ